MRPYAGLFVILRRMHLRIHMYVVLNILELTFAQIVLINQQKPHSRCLLST